MSEIDNAREFWLPLITTNGKLDERKILNELIDYEDLIDNAKEVYEHITGMELKVLTPANRVIELADSLLTDIVVNQIGVYEDQRQIDDIDFKTALEKALQRSINR